MENIWQIINIVAFLFAAFTVCYSAVYLLRSRKYLQNLRFEINQNKTRLESIRSFMEGGILFNEDQIIFFLDQFRRNNPENMPPLEWWHINKEELKKIIYNAEKGII